MNQKLKAGKMRNFQFSKAELAWLQYVSHHAICGVSAQLQYVTVACQLSCNMSAQLKCNMSAQLSCTVSAQAQSVS